MKWSIDDLISATQGSLIFKKQEKFQTVHIDTRNIHPNSSACFFALKGKRDGHNYLKEARQKNVHVLVVEDLNHTEDLKDQITLIQVQNTRKALVDFARFWRQKLGFKVVAITGSVGKTSAKHFCQILFEKDDSIQVSPHSYNNNLGIPLSLLQMNGQKEILIQEIGTNHSGEMHELCQMVQPDIAVCTVVDWSHVEGLGDIQQIAQEKERIYRHTSLALFNMDNSWTRNMYSRFQGSKITFSAKLQSADVFFNIRDKGINFLNIEGRIGNEKGQCRLSLAGEHYLTSVMTAVSIALALKKDPKDIWNALPLLKSYEGRSQFLDLDNKIQIFFDAYNANPCSMKAFLKYIAFLSESKTCILCIGDMLELGYKSHFFHQELGQAAGNLSIQNVFFIGQYKVDFEKGLKKSKFKGHYYLFKEYSMECCKTIFSVLQPSDILAVKASRELKLERIFSDLKMMGDK